MLAKFVPLLLLLLVYGVVRLLLGPASAEAKRSRVMRAGLVLAIGLAALVGFAVVHHHSVDARLHAWAATQGFSDRAVVLFCSADGRMRTYRSIFQLNCYYLIAETGHEDRVVQLGDWLVGDLGSTVTVVR